MQRWRKLGRLFRAEGQRPFMASHASCPMAQPLGGDLFRIWFAPRAIPEAQPICHEETIRFAKFRRRSSGM
jgi:hypothetical protein